jgi:hypothetical protein
MKNEILDEIIHDELRGLLKRGERVIWEGQPSNKINWKIHSFGTTLEIVINNVISWFLVILFGGIFLNILIFIFWDSSIETKFVLVVSFFVFLLSMYYRDHQKRRTKYIISNERILFQLWKKEEVLFENWILGHREYHSIPFSEINNIVIVEETPNKGVIFLAVKNPNEIPFDTLNFSSGERRHQPTLELVEEVKTVGEYIKMGIQGKL